MDVVGIRKWTCVRVDCRFINFGFRSVCRECGRVAPNYVVMAQMQAPPPKTSKQISTMGETKQVKQTNVEKSMGKARWGTRTRRSTKSGS